MRAAHCLCQESACTARVERVTVGGIYSPHQQLWNRERGALDRQHGTFKKTHPRPIPLWSQAHYSIHWRQRRCIEDPCCPITVKIPVQKQALQAISRPPAQWGRNVSLCCSLNQIELAIQYMEYIPETNKIRPLSNCETYQVPATKPDSQARIPHCPGATSKVSSALCAMNRSLDRPNHIEMGVNTASCLLWDIQSLP